MPGYLYAQQGTTVYVNLFGGGTADIVLGQRKVRIVQDTRYPWDGTVKMTVTPDRAGDFTIKIRVPGWARNEAAPGDLYRFLDSATEAVTLKVNGTPAPMTLDKGYVTLARRWQQGDVIELSLPMPVRRVVANDLVAADKGRVALQRGPIVYTAEWVDNANGHVRNLVLPDSSALGSQFRADLLNGVQVVTAKGYGLAMDPQGRPIKTEQDIVAIPYATWANRGRGEMLVWIPRTEANARPTPYPTVATTSTVTTSGRKNPRGVNDGEEPSASNDASSYFDWWPRNGCSSWPRWPSRLALSRQASERAVFTGSALRSRQAHSIATARRRSWVPLANAHRRLLRGPAQNWPPTFISGSFAGVLMTSSIPSVVANW